MDRDEHKATSNPVMSSSLLEMYDYLTRELLYLCSIWVSFKELFFSSKETIELMNSLAGGFFGKVQIVFWREIILQIHRLSDIPEMGGNKSVTFLSLPNLVDEAIKQEISLIVEEIEQERQKTKKLRNKRLGHIDLKHMKSSKELDWGDAEHIDEMIELFKKSINVVSGYYRNSEVSFIRAGKMNNTQSLLYALDKAKYVEQLQKQHLDNKEYEVFITVQENLNSLAHVRDSAS